MQTHAGLGARLNNAMFRRGLQRRELAVDAGVSHETLNQALNDRATARTVLRLERALRLKEGALLSVGSAPAPESGSSMESRAGEPSPVIDSDVEEILDLVASVAERRILGPRFLLALLSGLEEGARLDRQPLPHSYWAFRQQVYDRAIETRDERTAS